MNSRSRLIFLLVLPAFWSPLRASERLTLEQAIARALEASEELRISEEDVSISRLQAQEAGNRRLPQLDFSGQYLYTSEVMKMIQPPMDITIPSVGSYTIPGRETTFGDNHSVDFKLQVTQPVFTGFRLSKAYQAARRGVDQKQAEADRVRWQVRCKAEETYISAQKGVALRAEANLRVERMQRHLDEAQNRLKQGVAPQEVVARAQYALSQARLKQQEADHAYRLAEIALRELVDMPQSGEELGLDSLELAMFPTESPGLDFARAHRAEFKSLEAQNLVASQRVGAEKSAYYPTLSVFGALDYGRPGVDKFANEWMLYQVAGVNLSWMLWDWKIRRGKVEQIRAAQRQLEQSRSALESRVRLDLSNAQLSLDNARKRLSVAQEGLQLSEDVLKWVQDRYARGVATEKEYLDAQNDYSTSQGDCIIALADYRLAQVALKSALGAEP